MNINKLAFRSAASIITFVIGLTALMSCQYLFSKVETPEPTFVLQQVHEPVEAEPVIADDGFQYDVLNGNYYFFDEVLPRGFKDFESLNIETHLYLEDDRELIPIPPKGSIKSDRTYKFVAVSVSPNDLTFETESINGVSYRFTGKLWQSDPSGQEDYGAINGKLEKLKNKKVSATTDARFYAEGC